MIATALDAVKTLQVVLFQAADGFTDWMGQSGRTISWPVEKAYAFTLEGGQFGAQAPPADSSYHAVALKFAVGTVKVTLGAKETPPGVFQKRKLY